MLFSSVGRSLTPHHANAPPAVVQKHSFKTLGHSRRLRPIAAAIGAKSLKWQGRKALRALHAALLE